MTKLEQLKNDIAEMQSVVNDKDTPQNVKDSINPSLKKAQGMLKELEALEQKPAAKSVAKPAAKTKVAAHKPTKKQTTPNPKPQTVVKKVDKQKAKKIVSNIDALIASVKTNPKLKEFYAGTSKSSLRNDAKRQALKPGKRISATGNVYYENRSNHTDIGKRLAAGGNVENLKVGDIFYKDGEDKCEIVSIDKGFVRYKILSEPEFTHSDSEERFKRLIDNGKYSFEKMASGGSTIRANKSELLKYANFEDGSHINLLKLNEFRNQDGLRYKDGNKFAVSISSKENGQKVLEFKTKYDALDKFDKLVAEKRLHTKIVKENTTENFANGGNISNDDFVKKTIVYDNGGSTLDRYTVFTPDGSVYGMSETASGYNEYVGEANEVKKGSHLGKKLSSVPSAIEWAVIDRKESFANGGYIPNDMYDKLDKITDWEVIKKEKYNGKNVYLVLSKSGNYYRISVEVNGKINSKMNTYFADKKDAEIKFDETIKTFFEQGGYIPNNYANKTPQQVWDMWSIKQREHFLADHADGIPKEDIGSYKKDFKDLDFLTQMQLDLHLEQGQYAKGGSINNDIAKKIAIKFSEALRMDIDAEDMAEINKRNASKSYQDGSCATHDFVDANVYAAEAFESVTGREFNYINPETETENTKDVELFNKAWEIAKSNQFDVEKIKQNNVYAKGGNLAKIKSELANTSNNALVVVCKSVGNPDYQQYAAISPTKMIPVNSLKEAAEVCRKYISEWDLGGGNWGDGAGNIFDVNKKIVAHVSYNGRVWKGNSKNWNEKEEITGTELTKSYYAKGGKLPEKGTPQWHQLQVAKKTLSYSDAGAIIMGGMTKQEAQAIVNKYGLKLGDGSTIPSHFGTGKNIKVFSYQTQNFDSNAQLATVFENAQEHIENEYKESNESSFILYSNALENFAKKVDEILGLEKQIIEISVENACNKTVELLQEAGVFNYKSGYQINFVELTNLLMPHIATIQEFAALEENVLYQGGPTKIISRGRAVMAINTETGEVTKKVFLLHDDDSIENAAWNLAYEYNLVEHAVEPKNPQLELGLDGYLYKVSYWEYDEHQRLDEIHTKELYAKDDEDAEEKFEELMLPALINEDYEVSEIKKIMARGGGIDNQINSLKNLSQDDLLEYCKQNNIPYASGWSKEHLLETIEDVLLSRDLNGDNYAIVYEKPNDETGYTKTVYGNDQYEAEKVFYKEHPNCKITSIRKMFADGGGVDSAVEQLWNGYAEAVLFTEEEELGSDYTIYDFDEKTVTSTKKMLADYYKNNKKAIEESGLSLDVIGNDIWYTRSGQGAGFFDHSLDDEIEEKLTKGAKEMGEYPTVEASNGKVSVTGGRVFAAGGGVEEGKNGYVAFYKGKQMDVYANTSYEAQQKAALAFKAKKSYDVTVVLAKKGEEQVVHTATFGKGGGIEYKYKVGDTVELKNGDVGEITEFENSMIDSKTIPSYWVVFSKEKFADGHARNVWESSIKGKMFANGGGIPQKSPFGIEGSVGEFYIADKAKDNRALPTAVVMDYTNHSNLFSTKKDAEKHLMIMLHKMHEAQPGYNLHPSKMADGGNIETVLYACKIGQPDYEEEIITTDATKIEAAKEWAKKNGFNRFRVSSIDMNEKPNFGKTVMADGGRISEMVEHYNKYGWADSSVNRDPAEDAEFFKKIGKTNMSISTTSFTGNDIKYYDETRVYPKTGGFVEIKATGGKIESYLSSHNDMFSNFDNALEKKQVVEFVGISKKSNKKYWIKDSKGFSTYLYKGQLRANDSTDGIFQATKISVDKLNDSLKYKIKEENLHPYEQELVPYLDASQNVKEKPKNIDNENWKQFVKDNCSYFTIDEETDNSIQLTTRQNGNVGDEKYGEKDMDEAKNILKKIKKQYPNTNGNIYNVDEWVYLELELADKMAAGGKIEKIVFTKAEDAKFDELMSFYLNDGLSDNKAEKETLKEMVILFPRLKKPLENGAKIDASAIMAKGGKVGGRGWEGATKGKKITDIKQFKVGKYYLNYDKKFNAKNLIKITSLDKTGLKRPIVYAEFVRNTGNDHEFAIWDFELKNNEYYEAKEASHSPAKKVIKKKAVKKPTAKQIAAKIEAAKKK